MVWVKEQVFAPLATVIVSAHDHADTFELDTVELTRGPEGNPHAVFELFVVLIAQYEHVVLRFENRAAIRATHTL